MPIVLTHVPLPAQKAARAYTPMEWVQMFAAFWLHQRSWPETHDDNQWDAPTKQSQKDLGFRLPNRAYVTCYFEKYEYLLDLAERYLGGHDITGSPLLEPFVEQDEVVIEDTPFEQAVQLFVRHKYLTNEFPTCGPGCWNQSTLRRCRENQNKLPSYKAVEKAGGMKLVKNAAIESINSARVPKTFPKPAEPVVVAVVPVVEAQVVLVESEVVVGPLPEVAESSHEQNLIQQLADTIEMNAELRKSQNEALDAINSLQNQLRKAQDKLEAQDTELSELKTLVRVATQSLQIAPPQKDRLPNALWTLLDKRTREQLRRFEIDPEIKFICLVFDTAAKAMGVEV